MDSDSSASDIASEDNYNDWVETDEIPQFQCVACTRVFSSMPPLLCHCLESHSIDILLLWNTAGKGFYNFVGLINYLRRHAGGAAMDTSLENAPWLDNDSYLTPVLGGDQILCWDVESYYLSTTKDNPGCTESNYTVANQLATGNLISVDQTALINTSLPAVMDNSVPSSVTGTTTLTTTPSSLTTDSKGLVHLTKSQYHDLLHKVKSSQDKIKSLESQLLLSLQDMGTMRSVAKEMLDLGRSSRPPTGRRTLSVLSASEDEAYFESYAHYSIHEEMLKDSVRTETYRDFIYGNPDLFEGKVVLDVGCGTGILSMFAARAGAARVYAIDQSDIVYEAMEIVRENGLDDVVEVIHGRVEDVTLPVDRVDMIISEWMGYFLLYESMLDSVLFARDKWLRPGGLIYPDRCTINLTAISNSESHSGRVAFWDDVYGFKMSCMARRVLREGSVCTASPDNVLAAATVVADFNIATMGPQEANFESEFNLVIDRAAVCTCIVGYFDVFFAGGASKKFSFSTGPASQSTHWKQVVFMLPTPFAVKEGEVLCGVISCHTDPRDPRAIVLELKVRELKLKYILQ